MTLLPLLLLGACEPWCTAPCSELNGDVQYECGDCLGAQHTCQPGAPDYPGAKRETAAEPVQRVTVDAMGKGAQVGVAPIALATSNDDIAPGGEEELNCFPYMRTIGMGDQRVRICPVLNGIWTSFLDHTVWGSYEQALPAAAARAVAAEMRLYDAVGLGTWVGEDFDARVLAALRTHHVATQNSTRTRDEDDDDSVPLRYSIIVEAGREVSANLASLSAALGAAAVQWVQLGPPALDHVAAYAEAKARGTVRIYGVEDYTPDMLRAISSALPIATVQQEINALVRPSAEAVAACQSLGCQFVAYGPLLGGMLSDTYLGAARPTPDSAHSKQWDYLGSIDSWGDWSQFQEVLQTMRRAGDAHGGLPVSTVALAYVLQLEYVVAAIVGVRLGLEYASTSDPSGSAGTAYHRRHRRATLEALRLTLTADEVRAIDAAVEKGSIRDGLART